MGEDGQELEEMFVEIFHESQIAWSISNVSRQLTTFTQETRKTEDDEDEGERNKTDLSSRMYNVFFSKSFPD